MHTSPDVLALLALGETAGSSDERDHARDCPVCSEEVAELTRVVDVGRTSTRSEALSSPGPEVWERIRAELGFELELGTVTTATATEDRQRLSETAGSGAHPVQATVTDLGRHRDTRTDEQPRRRGAADPGSRRTGSGRRFAALAAAAAFALVVGAGAGIAYERHQLQPQSRVIATGTLQAFPQFSGASGTVQVVTDGRGSRTLVVQMSSPQPITGTPTVWLMDSQGKAIQRMGLMENGPTTIVIPSGMSIIERPVVNISAEPADDTNDVHDGQSILQGTLA